MPSEWRDCTLGECVTLLSGGTPSKSKPEYWGGEIPWVSAKTMKSFWVDASEDRLTQLGGQQATRLVDPGTTLLLVRGMTLHNDVPVCRVRRRSAFNQDVKAVLAKGNLHPSYLPHLLVALKPVLLSLVDSAGHGTGRLNTDSLMGMPIQLPSWREQEAVAAFADALEGKIALLRETNVTLEAIAQAIFKSWFVDFDPVRARAEGRDPEGVPPEVADLFPTEFEDSVLGAIPKDWQVVRIEDLLQLVYGKALKSTDRKPGDVLVYGSGGITGSHDQALLEIPTVIVGRKGTVGSLYWEDRPCFPIDTVFYVKPVLASLEFCFRVLQRLPLRDMNTDAAVPGLNRENVYRLKVCLPHPEILRAFEKVFEPLRTRMQANRHEIEVLADLRDTLLPRLISGKFRIPIVEEVLA